MTTKAPEALVGYDELAKFLSVSIRTAKTYVADGLIPFYRIGNARNATMRFDLEEVRAALAEPHE